MKSDVWRTECELLAPEITLQMYNLKMKNVAHTFSQFHFSFLFPVAVFLSSINSYLSAWSQSSARAAFLIIITA